MVSVLAAASFQTLMGLFDNVYHHEIMERLPWKPSARKEQIAHAARGGLYGIVFATLAGVTPTGAFALALGGILGIEAFLTAYDFVLEDMSRKLAWTERVTHTFLTLNFGVVLALWAPIIFGNWAHQPTGIHFENYGLPTLFYSLTVVGVVFWMFRDFFAANRIAKFIANDATNPFKLNLKEPKQRVLITGATGFIGCPLTKALLSEGHEVTIITRDKIRAMDKFANVPGKLTFVDSFESFVNPSQERFDIIINLAGEPIVGKRWTEKQKDIIFKSRVGTTEKLVNFISQMEVKPKTLINGSAIGYYGATISDTEVTETSAPAETETMSHKLCKLWEDTAMKAKTFGTRVVLLRTGIVLGRDGGVMSQMLFPFEFGVGGKMGSGKQWMPWIHVNDLLSMVAHSINDPTIHGPINGTAPNPVTNLELTKALGSVLRRPTFIPMPAAVIKIMFGSDVAHELLLTGQKVIPAKIQQHKFTFAYPQLDGALREIVKGEISAMKK